MLTMSERDLGILTGTLGEIKDRLDRDRAARIARDEKLFEQIDKLAKTQGELAHRVASTERRLTDIEPTIKDWLNIRAMALGASMSIAAVASTVTAAFVWLWGRVTG